ncbi:MAG: hypothetical protein J6Y78_01860 [Paludibacteraceae bacterium]|nr:hypothetical protein [Paludibacteraceae bacterium]
MKAKVEEFIVNFDEHSVKAVIKVKKLVRMDDIKKYINDEWLGCTDVSLSKKDVDHYELIINMEKDEKIDLKYELDAVAQIEAIERLFKIF